MPQAVVLQHLTCYQRERVIQVGAFLVGMIEVLGQHRMRIEIDTNPG
ncbi:hypothetical protein [Mycobacterium lepromatosis]|nr:hypothetical protein [Mycobacterium lepromatosis]